MGEQNYQEVISSIVLSDSSCMKSLTMKYT